MGFRKTHILVQILGSLLAFQHHASLQPIHELLGIFLDDLAVPNDILRVSGVAVCINLLLGVIRLLQS